MRKSSKIKLCLLSLPLMAVAVAAAACSGGEHTHTYSSEWAFNAETHWHPSMCSHDTKANKSDHTFASTQIPPSVTSAGYTLNICACGYSYVSDPVDSLPVESDLRYNENGHWKPVLNGEIDLKAHVFDESVIAPTCSTYGYTKHACECGYWYASAPTAPIDHTYDENVWEYNNSVHWHPTLCCGAKRGVTGHDFTESVIPASGNQDGYTEYSCNECGYSYQVGGHSFADTLSSDDYEHWYPATCVHSDEKTGVADHILVGNSMVCEVCGREISERRLAYELSAEKEYYIVTGIGSINSGNVEIPAEYRGKPVQEIADRAFKGAAITSVTFGANLKKIGAEAFTGTQITAAALPNGIEEIGAKAFANTKITSVTLVASIEKLGYAVFRDCTQLQTVEIESGLTALPPFIFEGCSSLTEVTGEAMLTEIGSQAFLNCTELTSLNLSACTELGFSAFGGCSNFVPNSLNSLKVAEEYALSGCAIVTATLPTALTEISDNLFNGCTNLTTVTSSATSIGKSAFEGCNSLSSVSLDGVRLIGDSAFKGCSSLSSLTLPDTVIRVGENAFTDTGLITVEGGVKYAANVVVGVNNGTTSVNVKETAIGIADSAFRGTNLSSVTLGGVRFIGVSAFRKCESLTAITFTESVKLIGANAFRESGLTSVTVPSTVETIGDNAFYDCKSLTSVTVNAKEIGRFAFSYTGVGRDLDHPIKERPNYAILTSVTLGDGVEVIGSNAFQYCPITSITLPESVTSIGKYSFAQTSLYSITIPASVTRIGEYAFYKSNLTSATFADATNWKAGNRSLTLESASQNAVYLKNTYLDIDWTKE
ncbi:MAG: leucine-rich repeat domain-containing protein [Clostridia bacterium]|nr:leucine-rich repeat domain-containing protein [Clostridia bacterium]